MEPTSTAAYGLAHIFAALSVTNKELKTRALAERGVTPDQYEQMQKLQKITPKRRDAGGAEDEEEAAAEAAAAAQLNQGVDEGSDPDTDALCMARVRRVAALGGVAVVARLLAQVACSLSLWPAWKCLSRRCRASHPGAPPPPPPQGSTQTREASARALRQMCVDESVRGVAVQQGALKVGAHT